MNKYSFFKKKYNGVEEVKGNRNNHSFIFKENNKKKFFKIFTRKSSFQRELNFYKNFKDCKVKKNIPKFFTRPKLSVFWGGNYLVFSSSSLHSSTIYSNHPDQNTTVFMQF